MRDGKYKQNKAETELLVYFRKQQSHPWPEECDHQGEATQKPSGAIDRDAESLRYLRKDSDHAKFRSDQSECAERKNIDDARNAHSASLSYETIRIVPICRIQSSKVEGRSRRRACSLEDLGRP